MRKVYLSNLSKKSGLSSVLTFAGLLFAANLNAACTDLGGGHISCDESVDATVYAGVAGSSLLDVILTGNNVHGVHNNNNGNWNFNGLYVSTTGSSSHAVFAQNGADITIGNNAVLTTNNTNSHAVNAQNSNATIGDNVKISTHGPNVPPTPSFAPPKSESYGINAAAGSNVIVGDNADILTTGIYSFGVYATGNSLLVIGDNATIATTGGDPYCGACKQTGGWSSTAVKIGSATADTSGVIIGDNANISTQGAVAPAISLYGPNSFGIIGDNAVITAGGDRNTNAVYMTNGGNLTIGNNAIISTTGDMVYYDGTGNNYNGQPIAVTGSSSAVFTIGDNADISTYGLYAHAVQFNDALVVIGDNARITTYGEGRYTGQSSSNEGGFGIKIRSVYNDGQDKIIVGDNAVVTTYGNQSLGVQIREMSTGIFGDNLTVATHGNTATAFETFDRSNTTVGDGAIITTQGNSSHAVRTLVGTSTSNSNATTVIGQNAFVFTYGDGSHAVTSEGRNAAAGSSIIIADNAHIGTTGINSYALTAQLYSGINMGDNLMIITEGSGSSAVYSQSGSNIELNNNAYIATKGSGAHALQASGANIDIEDGAYITTNGAGSYAINAQSGANISVGDNVFITTNNTNARAVFATGSSNIEIGDNVNIFTYGPNFPSQSLSHGVWAEFASNITIGDNATIITEGTGSFGVGNLGATGSDNVHITISDNARIITTDKSLPDCVTSCGFSSNTGWYSYGVYMGTKNSDITIGDNALISTSGVYTFAVAARNTDAAVYIGDNAVITTYGNNGSRAVMIDSSAKGVYVGDNVFIATYGNATSTGTNNPHAVQMSGGTFLAGDNATITTYGYDASGISASSYANIVLGDNARITTYGEGKYTGASSSNEGGFGIKIRGSLSTLTLGDNAVITTYGDQALGVQIRERSSAVFGDNFTITTYGNNADALENYDRSNVSIGDNASLVTHGNSSNAIHTLAYTSAGDAITTIGKGAVIATTGDNSHAVISEGRSATIGAQIILGTDTDISALGAGSYALYATAINGLITTNNSAKLNIFGDITAQNGGGVDLDLSDGSVLYGNTELGTSGSVINLAFDGSNALWRLKGNSSLTKLVLANNAVVDLTGSSSRTILNIDDLSGNGVFLQRIDLKNDEGDLIVINNSASGTYELKFDDSMLGGYSATGNESFTLIQQNSGGTYNANFTGEAYIGAYLYQVEIIGATQGTGTGGSGGVMTPVLNSAALSSISFANINYLSGYANTQTLLQRLGELDTDRSALDDVWIRTYAGKLDSFDKKFDVKDAGYYGFQAGFDRMYDAIGGKLFAGLTFGISKTDVDYTRGEGEVNSYDIGLYASYKNDDNFYADALLKYTKNKNEFSAVTSNGYMITGDGDTNAYSLSVEGGKRFNIGSGFYAEPQAELTYSKQSKGTSAASSGLTTKFDGYQSILGRVGTIFGYTIKNRANVYYKVGYIKEFDGDVSYSFNDESTKHKYELNNDVFDNAIGVTSTINGAHHIYFEGAYQIGDNFNNKKANFGYKYSF